MEEKGFYVSAETALRLKNAGFKELCNSCYGLSVQYRGIAIDEDKEYELKAMGLGDDIEYIEHGEAYNITFRNSEFSNDLARPRLDDVVRWLLKEKGIFISIVPSYPLDKTKKVGFIANICLLKEGNTNRPDSYFASDNLDDALETGINDALDIIEGKATEENYEQEEV